MFPKEAFILAGGKGERLRPLTNDIPKPMVQVQGKPILEHVIDGLVMAGVKKIILGVSYKSEKVEEYFGNGTDFGTKIVYSVEEGFLGTGGALRNAKKLISGKFLMLNGDTLMDVDFGKMNAVHEEKKALATLALVQVKDVSSYGIARIEGEKITEFVEKPAPKDAPGNWANAGAYVLEQKTIEMVPEGFNLIEKTLFPVLAGKGFLFGFRHFGQWLPTDDLKRLESARASWKPAKIQ